MWTETSSSNALQRMSIHSWILWNTLWGVYGIYLWHLVHVETLDFIHKSNQTTENHERRIKRIGNPFS